MTSIELQKYLSERDYQLTREEVLIAINPINNQMIDHILFCNGGWSMWDREGNYYGFTQKC